MPGDGVWIDAPFDVGPFDAGVERASHPIVGLGDILDRVVSVKKTQVLACWALLPAWVVLVLFLPVATRILDDPPDKVAKRPSRVSRKFRYQRRRCHSGLRIHL